MRFDRRRDFPWRNHQSEKRLLPRQSAKKVASLIITIKTRSLTSVISAVFGNLIELLKQDILVIIGSIFAGGFQFDLEEICREAFDVEEYVAAIAIEEAKLTVSQKNVETAEIVAEIAEIDVKLVEQNL